MLRRYQPLIFLHQASPPNPPVGSTALFVNTSGVPVIRSAVGVETSLSPTPAQFVFPFSYSGTLVVGTGKFRLYNDSGRTLTISAIRATTTTVPTGSSAIVDVNKNGTTLFTTQANRPTIAAAGSGTSGKVTNMDVTSFADGDYLTVDIDQVGSTIPGADLSVQVLAS